ncbi:MAG: hypothetical protein GX131_13790 [candidate division WS1 bacterium]|nr:hypothetical protein [candidate division WS1 bacterium]
MRMRLVIAVLALCVGSVWAQDDGRILLRYHWTAGDTITWNMDVETTGTMVINDGGGVIAPGAEMPIWSVMSMPMTLQVEDVDAEGNATLTMTMGIMQIDAEAMGQQQYICINPETGIMTVNGEDRPLPQGMAATVGEPFRMVLSPLGKVLEMEVPEQMKAMMSASGMDMTQLLQMSQQWGATFPEEAIAAGHVWEAEMQLPTVPAEGAEAAEGATGEATMLFRLREADDTERVAYIDMMGLMDFEHLPVPPMAGTMPGFGGGNMTMEIGPMYASVAGTFDFDYETGELLGSEAAVLINMTQRMNGTVETPDGKRDINMEILTRDMTVQSTVEVVR